MSETILLKGRHNLIEEIIKPFDLSKTDFSDTLVIFPGKRPPHFLKKAIAQKTGKPFNPPQTFSMDVFIDYIYREKLRRKNKDLEPCDAVAVIFELYQNSKLKLNDHHFNTFDRFLPIAFNLLNALEELRIEKIPFNAPMTACSAEPQILMSLYKPFYDYLNEHVYCTRASRYADVAEQAGQTDWTEYARIIMAGFYIFTRSETDLIRALLKQPHVTMYFQDGPGIDETLRLLKIKPRIMEGESLEPEVRIYQTADAHEEIFRLNTLLNGISNNELCTERNAIVLPNRDNLFPVLRHTLCRYNDMDYNISMGYPVTRTPLFGFLNIMLDVLTGQWNERFSAKDYLRFLLHPYIKNTLLGKRTDVTRILCHTVEEEFFKDQSKIYFTLDELEQDESLFGKVIQRIRNIDAVISADELKAILKNIHQNTIGRFIGIESIAGFAEQCISVIEFLNHQTTAPRHPFFNPFATPVINTLEKLKTGLIGKEKFSDLQAYRRFLNYYLQTEEVAFTGTPLKGLQVLGLLETRSIQFDHVFILDVNENTLPSSSETDVFLPPGTRKSMNLPTREQHDRIIKYYYSLLTQQARQVHLFYVNNDDQQRSRFIEEYLWQKQKESGKTDIENQFIEKISGTFRLDQSLPPPIVKNESMASILKNIEYSATSLDTYLKCGLKFYYRLVLKLYEKESLDEDIDALSIGELVHRILENYFLNKMNITLTENHLNSKELEECIDRQFTARFGQQNSGELLLMKQQIKIHLSDFVNHYQSDLIKSAATTITELETKINVVFHDYQLKGKIDRVERRDDRIYLIDYKTSGDKKGFISELSKFNPDDRKSWLKPLQLAFYWILFAEKNNIPPATIYPLFLLLGCKTIDTDMEVPLNEPSQNTIERYDIFKNMILSLLQEINDLSINFHPPEKANDHCPDCEFNNICGMQWAKKGY